MSGLGAKDGRRIDSFPEKPKMNLEPYTIHLIFLDTPQKKAHYTRMTTVAVTLQCKECGKTFEVKPRLLARKQVPDYCGKTCKSHAYWRRRIEREEKEMK